MKVIPGEECASQHRLLVCDLNLTCKNPSPKPFVPKRQVSKLCEHDIQLSFHENVVKLLDLYDSMQPLLKIYGEC